MQKFPQRLSLCRSTIKYAALAAFLMFGLTLQASAKSFLIVCIGADNTAGRGTGHKHPGGVGREQAFPAQLEKMLHARGIDAKVVNAGVPHINTAGIYQRLDQDIPAGASLVLIDRAKGNDRQQGGIDTEGYVEKIEKRLDERHIRYIQLPAFGDIAGQYRDSDGRHYTPAGHTHIAEYALPFVLKALR